MKREYFAYGDDSIGNYDCPAKAVGYRPNDGDFSTTIAEKYDKQAEDRGFVKDEGILPRKEAKNAWLEALNELREKNEKSPYDYSTEIKIGERIAKTLDWPTSV